MERRWRGQSTGEKDRGRLKILSVLQGLVVVIAELLVLGDHIIKVAVVLVGIEQR